MEKNTKIIKTIQSLDWNLVYYYLQMMHTFTGVMNDNEFRKIFDILEKFVSDKIVTPYSGNIQKTYVVVEQEAIKDDYEKWLNNNKEAVTIE